jgi:TusA-related sulfurtransferase
MRKLDTGQILEVWADDEGAKADIPAWCMGTGNDFIGHEEFGDQMKFLIRKLV